MKTHVRFALAMAALGGLPALADVGRLHPKFEGVYEVTVRCRAAPCGFGGKINRAVLMDEGHTGIRINFLHTSTGVPIYLLLANRIDNAGAHLEADAFQTNHRAIEWVGDIDPVTGALSGRIRDGMLTGDLEVVGKRLDGPGGQYQPQPVSAQLSPLELRGDYRVIRSSDTGLTLRTTLTGNPPIVGTWNLGSGARIDFGDSEFMPEQGVLILYSKGSYSAIKWTVALRRSNTGVIEGDAFCFSSANGKFYHLALKR